MRGMNSVWQSGTQSGSSQGCLRELTIGSRRCPQCSTCKRKITQLPVVAADRMATTARTSQSSGLEQANSLTVSSLGTLDDYRIVANIDAAAVPDYLKKDCVLFYTPDTEPLARKIAGQAGSHVELGNIRWK